VAIMKRLLALFALFAFTPGLVLAAEDEALLMSVDERVEAPTDHRDDEAAPPTSILPMPMLEPAVAEEFWGLFDEWIPGLPSPRRSWPARLLILALFALFTFGLGRLRARLPRAGLLPRVSGLVHFFARVGLFVALVVVASHLVPAEMMPVVFMVMLAMAAAVGWSLRDFLPDVIAGVVLLFEARMKPGVWVAGEGFSGFVERVGVRATWLRDVYGHREAVPNHRVLKSTLVLESTDDAMQEVRLCLQRKTPAATTRTAIYDATLSSPWVLSRPAPVVLRDPRDENTWLVRAKLLHQKYAGRFEGELLERTEEMLDAWSGPRETEDEPAG
jgi:hypothetical protein